MSSCQWLRPLSCTQRTSWNLLVMIRAGQQFNWQLLLCISWATKVGTLIFCNQILELRLLNPWEVPVTSVQSFQSPAALFGNLSTFLFRTERGGWTDLESEHQIKKVRGRQLIYQQTTRFTQTWALQNSKQMTKVFSSVYNQISTQRRVEYRTQKKNTRFYGHN